MHRPRHPAGDHQDVSGPPAPCGERGGPLHPPHRAALLPQHGPGLLRAAAIGAAEAQPERRLRDPWRGDREDAGRDREGADGGEAGRRPGGG